MNLRGLLKERETLLARATELVEMADKEERDFTDEEREEYQAILGTGEETGKIGELDARIDQLQDERERLRNAAAKRFGQAESEKPESKGKVMKRDKFNALSQAERTAYIKAGGKVED